MEERIKCGIISAITGSVAAFITVWLLVNTGYIKECSCTTKYTSATTKQYDTNVEEENINVGNMAVDVGNGTITNIVNNLHNDAKGQKIQLSTDPQYYYVGKFSEGLAPAQKEYNGKFGYIDREGNVVIDFQFEFAGNFRNGKASITDENSKWGKIDKNGNIVIEPKYDTTFQFDKDGKAEVRIGFRDYIIDEKGNILQEIKD